MGYGFLIHRQISFKKGQFDVWAETDEVKSRQNKNLYPQQLHEQAWLDFN